MKSLLQPVVEMETTRLHSMVKIMATKIHLSSQSLEITKSRLQMPAVVLQLQLSNLNSLKYVFQIGLHLTVMVSMTPGHLAVPKITLT